MIHPANVRTSRRPAMVSVVVLIALIVVAIACAALLKVALARRDAVRIEERRLQAAWLAESGLERASARLASQADYPGETWTIPTEDLGGRGTGSILIRVEKPPGHPERRTVHVQADYPANATIRSRESREMTVTIPQNSR